MSATDDSTFDLDPPYRPGLSDLGGGTKLNHPKYPPNPVTMPTAPEWNHFAKLLEKLGAIVPIARVHVRITAGAPSIQHVVGMRAGLVAADFTIQDHGVGDTSLRWIAAGVAGQKLPATSGAPSVSVAQDLVTPGACAFYTTISSMPAVRIKTFSAGAAADADFVVDIY